MKLAFSSLACIDWSLEEVAVRAVQFGYQGVELRGMNRQHISPEFTPQERQEVVNLFRSHHLEIPCITAYTRFTSPDAEERRRNEEDLERYVDLAADLGAFFVRTFGGEMSPGIKPELCFDYMAESLSKVADYASARGVTIILETHDDFSDTSFIVEVMKRARHEHLGVLWDILHPLRFGELVEETFSRIKEYLRYLHVKDGKKGELRGPWPLVRLGEGEVPLRKILKLLSESGFQGYLCVEWEKAWHPELEDSLTALPYHAHKIKEYLQTIRAPF